MAVGPLAEEFDSVVAEQRQTLENVAERNRMVVVRTDRKGGSADGNLALHERLFTCENDGGATGVHARSRAAVAMASITSWIRHPWAKSEFSSAPLTIARMKSPIWNTCDSI